MANSNAKSKDAKKSGIISFFGGVKAEVKKITWPSATETKKTFIAALLFTLVYAVLVGGFDYIFQNLFELILKK